MKLQRRFLRKVKNKSYYKYMINIPPEAVEQSGIKEGDELEASVEKKGEIRVRRK
jgi:bifunctional DNA-binding transcriptional regulator/antitoxin component of YhaV-PrlF toxin-antitoxin module